MIESALTSYLLANGDIASLVGTRVYPVLIPQRAALPLLVYQVISDMPDYHLRGESGLTVARIQIDCVAATYSQVKTLAQYVRLACGGYRGQLGTVAVEWMNAEQFSDMPAEPRSGEQETIYRVIVEIRVAYQQTAAALMA
jgi:hypothetical protein